MNRLDKFNTLLREKKSLMGCIFITLFIQLIITTITVLFEQKYKFFLNSKIVRLNKLLFTGLTLAVTLGLVFLMTIPSVPFFIKQILFLLLSITFGLLLSLVIHYINDPNIIKSALIATISNFILLFIIGLIIVYLGYDLGWMGIYLIIALLVIFTLNIINALSSKSSLFKKILSMAIVLLFSLFILYDTNNILLKYGNTNNDCIRGALDYYIDIINLFQGWIGIGE